MVGVSFFYRFVLMLNLICRSIAELFWLKFTQKAFLNPFFKILMTINETKKLHL